MSNRADEGEMNRIREALRGAIEQATLRAVALQVGMSPTGLQHFLGGAEPYAKTREKARMWYYRQVGFGGLDGDDARTLLRRMVGTLPEPDRGVVRMLDSVDAAYREAGMYAPRWVARVRRAVTRGGRDEGAA